MNPTYPLFRLLWRPGVLFDLVVTSVFAAMIGFVGGAAGQVLFHERAGSIFGLMVVTEYPPGSTAPSVHLCLLAGAVIGVVANFAMQDLLYCRFSWGLPRLGAQLRTALWWLAALATGIGAAAGVIDGRPGWLQGAAFGLAGFALGNQWWDPKIGRGFCFASQLLLIAAIVGATQLERGIEHVPWLPPLVALALVVFSIHRATRRGGRRTRALVPSLQLGLSFRPASDIPRSVLAGRGGQAASRSWSEGPVLDRRGWIRALLYENAGWMLGAWRGGVIRIAAGMALLAALGNFFTGRYHDGTLRAGLEAITTGIFEPLQPLPDTRSLFGPNFVTQAVLLGGIILVLHTRLDLRRGVIYPLSRKGRAGVVWWACLRQQTALGLTTVALFILLGLVTSWPAGVDVTLNRVPEVVVAACLIVPLLPILQGARLRFVDSGRIGMNSVSFGAAAGIVGIILLKIHDSAVVALREAEPKTAAVVALGILPVLWLISLLGFRWWLKSWFARADLV